MSLDGHHSGWRCFRIPSLFTVLANDIAIDFGTANTLVYAHGRGLVSISRQLWQSIGHGRSEAVGKDAKEMLGHTPANIAAIKPMKDGVIAGFKVTERMLSYFIRKACRRQLFLHPRMVIAVPSEISQVERSEPYHRRPKALPRRSYLVRR